MSLPHHIDGGTLTRPAQKHADYVVVGSGPAGATVAMYLAEAGYDVVVFEEGPMVPHEQHPASAWDAMRTQYRDLGASVALGEAPMPYVQGRMLGGSSVINGAISWRLPHDVYEEWCEEVPGLESSLPWEEIEVATDTVERDLHIAPTDPKISGPHNLLMGKGADELGLEHRPINRTVRGCEGLGRCLQGCPKGHKMSMDRSYIPRAALAGAEFWSNTRVTGIETTQYLGAMERARSVQAVTKTGQNVSVTAEHGVVLAASAVQTPALLLRSGLKHGPVGEHFQAHPGVAVSALFPEPVRMWTGATQGHEVTGLRKEGIKFEALGFDLSLAAARMKGVGSELAENLSKLDHFANWGAAIRAEAHGRVRPSGQHGVRVTYSLTREDRIKVRRGVAMLGRLFLAAGAREVLLGVHGWDQPERSPGRMDTFERIGPLEAQAYSMAMTHLFGTCRMSSDALQGVVGTDFQHHRVKGLFIADSSIFPSNTGVNPQTSIIALASICAQRMLEKL